MLRISHKPRSPATDEKDHAVFFHTLRVLSFYFRLLRTPSQVQRIQTLSKRSLRVERLQLQVKKQPVE